MHRLLILLYLAGIAGFTADLYLLEHYETWYQRIPLVGLAAGAVAAFTVLVAPRTPTLWLHRCVALFLLAAGVFGQYLHYQGNAEFELELYPSLQGAELFWKSMSGASPTLAPFALAHLGLLGLISTYRHPRLRRNHHTPRSNSEVIT